MADVSLTHFLFFLASTALALWTSCHAILYRRDPRSVIIWMGVSWIFPIVGPLSYWFFGINRIERKGARLRRHDRRKRPRSSLAKDASSPAMPPEMKQFSRLAVLVDRVVQSPLTEGNKITPLQGPAEAYPAMLEAIASAQKTIGLSTYIFNNDAVGRVFIEALATAVKRGVEVRVLIDDVGSGFAWSSVYKALLRAGIKVAYFLPTLVPVRMAYMNLRSHRKILTIDGQRGFTGGLNIWAKNYQDAHFKIEGPVVTQMQEAFWVDWHFASGEKLPQESWFPPVPPAGPSLARGIADGPDEDLEKFRWTIHGAIAHAEHSIKIVTPYFVPDNSFLSVLSVAAMSGVRVDILLPEVNDMIAVKWASQAAMHYVLDRNCHVWLTPAPFDHSKLMIVDGAWTIFGSSNMDTRSFRLNFEFNVESYDTELGGALEKMVDEKIKRAKPVTLKMLVSRPLPIRLRDGLARLLSPYL